jgi:hypothetical protein
VNEQVTVPASGDGSGDSEMNVRVNGGAHPSRREPTTRPPESPALRSGLHRALAPLVPDGEANAWGSALPARFARIRSLAPIVAHLSHDTTAFTLA